MQRTIYGGSKGTFKPVVSFPHFGLVPAVCHMPLEGILSVLGFLLHIPHGRMSTLMVIQRLAVAAEGKLQTQPNSPLTLINSLCLTPQYL